MNFYGPFGTCKKSKTCTRNGGKILYYSQTLKGIIRLKYFMRSHFHLTLSRLLAGFLSFFLTSFFHDEEIVELSKQEN